MPNQLSKNKRRQSLAEHEAILSALKAIARYEKTSVMALLREAVRDLVKRRASNRSKRAQVRRVVLKKEPRMPARFKTAAEVARFKHSQREFDQVLLDLALISPVAVQKRNSIVPARRSIRPIKFG